MIPHRSEEAKIESETTISSISLHDLYLIVHIKLLRHQLLELEAARMVDVLVA